jgi:hypothetical protein
MALKGTGEGEEDGRGAPVCLDGELDGGEARGAGKNSQRLCMFEMQRRGKAGWRKGRTDRRAQGGGERERRDGRGS